MLHVYSGVGGGTLLIVVTQEFLADGTANLHDLNTAGHGAKEKELFTFAHTSATISSP